MAVERYRTSISVPKAEDEKHYKLTNKATGEVWECGNLIALLRIVATYAATSEYLTLELIKEDYPE